MWWTIKVVERKLTAMKRDPLTDFHMLLKMTKTNSICVSRTKHYLESKGSSFWAHGQIETPDTNPKECSGKHNSKSCVCGCVCVCTYARAYCTSGISYLHIVSPFRLGVHHEETEVQVLLCSPPEKPNRDKREPHVLYETTYAHQRHFELFITYYFKATHSQVYN